MTRRVPALATLRRPVPRWSVEIRTIACLSAATIALTLAGCTVRWTDLSQRSSSGVVLPAQSHYYGKPKHGDYWCLSVKPGTPIPDAGGGVTYSTDVVAFNGFESGGSLQIILDNGLVGQLSERQVSRYEGPTPSSTCTVYAVGIKHLPVFDRR